MTIVAFRQFSGEIPKTPATQLPENAAQKAVNCDFSKGVLSPLKQGFLLKQLSGTIKGLYTEEGLNFFTWTTDVTAYKSPVIDEQYQRVYYLNGTDFTVTTYNQASTSGGAPASTWKAGVPNPTVAPVLTLIDRTTLPDYPSISLTWTGWYEYQGVRYQEAAITPTQVTAFKSYTFTAPAKTAGTNGTAATVDPVTGVVTDAVPATNGTPTGAKFVVKLVIRDTAKNQDVLVLTSTEGAIPSKSVALPGGVEMQLACVTAPTAYSITMTWGATSTRAYVYTVNNTWGEESGPSPASLISPTYIQDVQIVTTNPTFTGYRPQASGTSGTNIYRTFGTNPNYLRTTVSNTTGTTFVESTTVASNISVGLTTLEFLPPPSNLSGIALMPNGWFVGFKDNVLWMSEPYRPSAWPYNTSFTKNIRGVIVGQGNSLVVTTADATYILTGSHPKATSTAKLPIAQAGVAQRSMTTVDGAVVFASQDGVVAVEGSQATLNLSQKYWNREDWRARYGDSLNDASLRFGYSDGFLVGLSYNRAAGFIVRFDEAPGTLTQFNQQFDTMLQLPVTDTLYYTYQGGIYQFRGSGTNYAMEWWSKTFIFPEYKNFGAGYIRCDGPTTIELYANEETSPYYSVTINSTGYFRLPAGRRELRWSFRVTGSSTVHELAFANDLGELRSV